MARRADPSEQAAAVAAVRTGPNPINTLAAQIVRAARDSRAAVGLTEEERLPGYRESEKKALRASKRSGNLASNAGRMMSTSHTRDRITDQGGPPRTSAALRLEAVADVLLREGLDPTVEMVRILKGSPDAENPEKTTYAVDPDTRLRYLNELLKYTQPQKRSVETKVVTPIPSAEEAKNRVSVLLQQAMAMGLGEEIGRAMAGGMGGEIIDIGLEEDDWEDDEEETDRFLDGPAADPEALL